MALAGRFLKRGGRSVGTEENKGAQRRIIDEVINRKNLDLADELFAEGHELHPEAAGVGRGPEGMKRAFAGLHEEFPDVRVEIESMVAEGDLVAARLTFSGTHAPTGERAAWPEMLFARFSGGKAAESWEVTDTGRGWDSPPW
jgi:predicted ester cyclase